LSDKGRTIALEGLEGSPISLRESVHPKTYLSLFLSIKLKGIHPLHWLHAPCSFKGLGYGAFMEGVEGVEGVEGWRAPPEQIKTSKYLMI
jgi:hypothetical protein